MVGSHLLISKHNNIQYVGETAKTTNNEGEASMIWKIRLPDTAKVTNEFTVINLFLNLLGKYLCFNTFFILIKFLNIQDVFRSQVLKYGKMNRFQLFKMKVTYKVVNE